MTQINEHFKYLGHIMNITLLGATRKRPLLLQRMFDSAIETAKHQDLIEMSIYVDKDDLETQEHLKTMKGNIQVTVGERIVLSDMWNKAYKKANADILMGCSDDLIFRSKDWDEKIINIFNQYEDKIVLVHANDLIQGIRITTVPFLHRRWVETLGYFLPPYFSCDRADVWLTEISKALNRRIYLPDMVIEHMHYSIGKAKYDETYAKGRARGRRDNVHRLYGQLTDKRLTDIQKLRHVMKN